MDSLVPDAVLEVAALPRFSAPARARPVSVALQGGGAHGAFAWGVLDRMLETQTVAFEAISGTSAGAMNAVVMADGLARGGQETARERLHDFWQQVAAIGALSPLQPTLLEKLFGMQRVESSPAFVAFEMMTRLLSPYQFNPAGWHPLRELIRESVDFDLIREADCSVFVCATNVRTGMPKIFGTGELDVDRVLASAALPFLFHAVEIEGEHYWDGGYLGNPPIYPLIESARSPDVVVIHTNPLRREEVPRSAQEIINRINEISFNSTLMRELRDIAFVTRLIDEGAVLPGRLRRIFLHSINADTHMAPYGWGSKLFTDWSMLQRLRDLGRAHADAWLQDHFESLGKRSTLDLEAILT